MRDKLTVLINLRKKADKLKKDVDKNNFVEEMCQAIDDEILGIVDEARFTLFTCLQLIPDKLPDSYETAVFLNSVTENNKKRLAEINNS